MSIRKHFERLAWRLAGFNEGIRVHPTSRIKGEPNPVELLPQSTDRLLVFSPHPDDDVIGCGGLIATALSHGAGALVAYVTDGALGGDPDRRKEEARAAQAACRDELRATYDIRFLGHREMEISAPRLAAEFGSLREECAPTWILVPHPADNHYDHRDVTRIVCQAVRRSTGPRPRLLGYEVWSPLAMQAFVDISPVGALKRRLISAHASQQRTKDYAEMILALNAYRAVSLPGNATLTEAFELIEEPRGS
jgi:N-acetylglucosamine malate deacetylase 1